MPRESSDGSQSDQPEVCTKYPQAFLAMYTGNPFFVTRGVVVGVRDIETLDWPQRASRAGLTTIATHIFPNEIAHFLKTDSGQRFLKECGTLGIHVEHELHALSDLLPRSLFERNPEMFRMNEEGVRVCKGNMCVHSREALDIVSENVARFTQMLPSTTGRYFYWGDDGIPWCRCPNCRTLSDSDQALLVENEVLRAVRSVDPRGTLAHLAYYNTLLPPCHVKPSSGIFLEFAPIQRTYAQPLSARAARYESGNPSHGELLDALDANLDVFGREGAQVLEYWLDVSRFSGWKRDNIASLPWKREVFLGDLETYASRGIQHITSFTVWLDREYVSRFGDLPIEDYGAGLLRFSGENATQVKSQK